jgi:hypothetical protein
MNRDARWLPRRTFWIDLLFVLVCAALFLSYFRHLY